jgi:hypothetical protein
MMRRCGDRWRGTARRVAVGVSAALTCTSLALGPLRAETATPVAAADSETVARQFFPSDERKVPAARIYRLSRDQIDATVRSLLPGLPIKSVKSAMQRDPLQTNYEYAELIGLNTANLSGLTGWIADIARLVRQSPTVVIKCADVTDEACLKAQARAFAIKSYRGDVTSESSNRLVEFYVKRVRDASFPQATGDLVEVVLNAPDFLFRREIDTVTGDRLAPAQLLQALTYTLADAPPDGVELPSARADQVLRSGSEAAATIGTLLQTKAARAKLQRFLKAWLEIKEPGEFTISQSTFPEFKQAYAAGMLSDVNAFLATHVSRPAPSMKDIMQGVDVGAPAASSNDPIAAKIAELDGTPRAGLLTMPAVIASHSGPTDSRPIKRGVFWARKVLCLDMEPPPKELHAKLYEMTGVTERHRIEQSTKGAACIGCHKIINPLGFFLEGFDALGRARTIDNGHPIDTRVLIDFLGTAPVTTETATDAIEHFTNSSRFKQCFVRQMFRFYMGRTEEPADDFVLRRMFVAFADDDSQDIQKALFALTSSDRLVRRK